jgi:hypothetical protein
MIFADVVGTEDAGRFALIVRPEADAPGEHIDGLQRVGTEIPYPAHERYLRAHPSTIIDAK